MDKDQIIKYVAIAAGAYLIYTFLSDAGYLDGLLPGGNKDEDKTPPAGGATPPAGGATPPAAPPTAPPAAPPVTPPPPTPPPPTAPPGFTGTLSDRLVKRLGPGRHRFNVDQWLFYTREVSGYTFSGAEADAIKAMGEPGETISMGEFFTRLETAGVLAKAPFAGMAGMDGGWGMGYLSPWAT